ncbi:hypothetical protein ACQEU8_36710 [Streptomyces sp. CA-250714]|uniref:hypothetical protein n=1 Tax=Streptomyces sp. CA-250714 TaxID=3240060 RepID=UPI003D929BCE
MTRTPPDQLAALAAKLGTVHPAAPELVLTTADQLGTADEVRLPSRTVGALLRRLLAVETDLATTRQTVARVVYDANEGDDWSMSDLMYELEHAGVPIAPELDHIDAVRTAEYRAQALG